MKNHYPLRYKKVVGAFSDISCVEMRRYLSTKPWNYISTAPKKDSGEDQLQPCQWSSTKTCHKSKTTYHWNQPRIWNTFDHWHRTVINGRHSPSKLWRLLRRSDLTTRTRKANKSSKSCHKNCIYESAKNSLKVTLSRPIFLSFIYIALPTSLLQIISSTSALPKFML